MPRLLVMSDFHCGHVAGLTPPRWQFKPTGEDKTPTKREKWYTSQKETWDWYARNVTRAGPFDVILFNGDAIDGRGERSGGTELVTVDRMEQCDMAIRCLQRAMTKGTKLVMTYGTGYHTGDEEDWEANIASDLNAEKIGSHEWFEVGGVVFDAKHHIGASSIPHGRHTATAKADLWNALWAERGKQPRCDVLIRSHVHYFQYAGDAQRLRLTTPALQGMGSKYGSRRCEGLVDFGFVVFECEKGQYSWEVIDGDLSCHNASVLKL